MSMHPSRTPPIESDVEFELDEMEIEVIVESEDKTDDLDTMRNG